MIIAMVTSMSGGRYDDRQWPPPGIPFEVPDEEGEGLIRWHHAVKLADSPAPVPEHVTAPAPVSLPAETAAGPVPAEPEFRETAAAKIAEALALAEREEPPKPSDPKADWVEYAVRAKGADPDVAFRMSKADLMSRFGGRILPWR